METMASSLLRTWMSLAVVVLMWSSRVEAQPEIQANGLFVVGKEKTLGCFIQSADASTTAAFPLTWSKNGVPQTPSQQQQVPVTSNVVAYNSFYKLNVSVSDNLAVIACTATFVSGTTSSTWTVYTYKGPDKPIISGPSSVVSDVSSTWTCLVDGASNNAPNVFWQFGNNTRLDSNTFSSAAQVYTDSNQLEINRVTSTLTLTLTPGAPSFTLDCRAVHFDTSLETSSDFPVTVLYPPQITGGNVNYTVTEGSTTTLYCQISAYPLIFSVTWYKNGVRLYPVTSGRLSGGTVLSPSLIINGVVRSDGGFYMCGATNSQGSTNGTSNLLTVRYKPVVTYSQNPVSGLSGSVLTLSCNINAFPLYTTVFWFRIDANTGAKTQISSSINPSKYVDGTAATTPALSILSLEPSDSGLYRCVVDNDVARGEGGNLQVEVNSQPYKPQITGGQSSLTGTEPQPVTLTCQVDALPALQSLTWYKDGQPLDAASESFRYSGGTVGSPSLTILSVGAADGGQYYCAASNSVGSTNGATTTLTVDYYPMFTFPDTAVAGSNGESVTLTVAIAANPAVTSVQWRKRDTAGSGSYQVLSGGRYQGGTVGSPSLLIPGLTSADSGYYYLVASNALGQRQSADLVLTVTSLPPTPSVSNLAGVYREGDPVTLTCAATPAITPSPSFRWYRGQTLVSEGPVLSIVQAAAADNGQQFTCEAYNALGTTDVTVTLNVEYKPRASSSLANVTISVGQTVTLTCAVQANPSPSSYSWTRNGQVISSSAAPSGQLTVTVDAATDLGQYTCRASNAVGTSDPINVFIKQASGGGDTGNVGASTEDSGLSTATVVLIVVVLIIIVIVAVLVTIYLCSTRKCFRKENDVGPSQAPAPPPPAVIPNPSKAPAPMNGYYRRSAAPQTHISMDEDKAALNGFFSRTPGVTISLPGGHSPRPHHLPPLDQDGVPHAQEKESARGDDEVPKEKKKKKRRRRHHDPESGSPRRYDYHDHDFDI